MFNSIIMEFMNTLNYKLHTLVMYGQGYLNRNTVYGQLEGVPP